MRLEDMSEIQATLSVNKCYLFGFLKKKNVSINAENVFWT